MQFRTIFCVILVLISAVSAALFDSFEEGYGRFPKTERLSSMMRIGKRSLPLQDAAHLDYYYPCENCNMGSFNRLG